MLLRDFTRTDKLITKALTGGGLKRSEALFLHRISERIDKHRFDSFLSQKEAAFLHAILSRLAQ